MDALLVVLLIVLVIVPSSPSSRSPAGIESVVAS